MRVCVLVPSGSSYMPHVGLAYMTDRITVMGFPGTGLGLYCKVRNRREDVKKLLDRRHRANYRVFKFCPIQENLYPSQVEDW